MALVLNPEEVVDPALTTDERQLLSHGMIAWGGPARCTERLALAMGFASVDHLLSDGLRIAQAIDKGLPLTRRDWTRALLGTEIVFSSDLVGSGRDWTATTGLDDTHTITVLRGLQAKSHRFTARTASLED